MASNLKLKNANGANAEITLINPDTNTYRNKEVDVSRITTYVDTIADLSLTAADGDVVFVIDYHSDIEGGGGVFVYDSTRLKSKHNGGTIIDQDKVLPDDWSVTDEVIAWFSSSNTGNGCWVRQNVSEIRWEDFGLSQSSMSGTVFQHPFYSGLAEGIAYYVLPDHELTLTSKVEFTVPAGFNKAVSIIGRGRISFSYAWNWPAVRNEQLFTITGNGSYPVHIELDVDGAGMGRYPDVWRVVTGISVNDAPSSEIRVKQSEMFGFGTRIYNSNGSNVYINSINCDGQKTTVDPGTGAKDNYGDALYISSPDVTVYSPNIKTTNGGRGGIVFESFTEQFSGVVINPTIDGYDRNIHVEGGESSSGNVTIQGGRLLNGNQSIWNFSRGSVTAIGVDFQNTTQVSVSTQAVPVIAYCSTYSLKSKTRTIGCRFRTNLHPLYKQAIYASGEHLSDADKFDNGCGRITITNSKLCAIINPIGDTEDPINVASTKRLTIDGGRWSGNIELPSTNDFEIRNMTMGRVGEFCGKIVSSNKLGGVISNVLFENPQTYCIDNYRDSTRVGPKPVFEGITAKRLTEGSIPSLVQYTPTSTTHLYRSSLPSYIHDTIAGTCSEIAPVTT